MNLRDDEPMNCYPFHVHLPDFEDLVYESQNLANLVVSYQVGPSSAGFTESRYGLRRATI